MIVPALCAREVTYAYTAGPPVLRDLSLAIAPGGVTVLLGANGSGKSTLFKLLSGILHPHKGRVELFGYDLSTLGRRDVARRIALVPQDELNSSYFTVRELVAFGRHPWQGAFATESPRDRECIERALSDADLTFLASRRAEELSGGERRRVQVAMALAQEPSVLLLDEPTTFLDIKHTVRLLDLVTEGSRRAGHTVVMILHDLNLAAAYADRAALLAGGSLLCEGPPHRVLTSEHIASAYGIDAAVTLGAGGRPHIVLRTGRSRAKPDGARIHVIGGGGAAANLLIDLINHGYRVTLGVVNQGDLDAAVAADWGAHAVLVPTGSPVSPEAASDCAEIVSSSAAVVVANMPFGPGNLANLRLALQARRAGLPVLVVAEDPMSERDFTAGEATVLMRELLASGAQELPREQMVAERLKEIMA